MPVKKYLDNCKLAALNANIAKLEAKGISMHEAYTHRGNGDVKGVTVRCERVEHLVCQPRSKMFNSKIFL